MVPVLACVICIDLLFLLQKKNVPLCAAIGTKEFSHYFADGETRLIQCFINPDMMVNNPVEGTETAEYDPNQHEEKTELQKKRDPLYEWFLINREGK